VGKISKAKNKKNRVGAGEKIKFPKKKQRSGEKNCEGGGEKIKLQKKETEIRAEKGQK
jgi:hypothetical protein